MQTSDKINTKVFPLTKVSNDNPIDIMVRDLLSEKLGIDFHSMNEGTSLADDLDIDSLDLIETVAELEKRFKIKISDEETEKLRTVGSIIHLIKSKI
jgi:acyl carrier protein